MEKNRPIRAFVSRFIKNEQGLEMVEYMLIAAIVVIAVIFGFKAIGKKLHSDTIAVCEAMDASNCR